jgi:hypothetical protein
VSRWSFDAIAFRKALQLWISLLAPIGVGVMLYCEIVFDHYQHIGPFATIAVAVLGATKLTATRSFLVELRSTNPRIPTLRIVVGDQSDPSDPSPEKISSSPEATSSTMAPQLRSKELSGPTNPP